MATTCSPNRTATLSPSPPTRPPWLKRYYPLEFFVALMNNQPMGFYPVETLKQDARRFGVPFLNPCVNRSKVLCDPESGAVRLGLQLVKDVGAESAKLHRGGKRATRPLRQRWRPGAADGAEAPVQSCRW